MDASMDATDNFQRAAAAYSASQRHYADLRVRGSTESALQTQSQLTARRYESALAAAQKLRLANAALVAEAESTGVSGRELDAEDRQLAAKLRRAALLHTQEISGAASLAEASEAADNALLRTNAESLRVGLLVAASAALAAAAVVNMA